MLDPVALTKRFLVVLETDTDNILNKHVAPLINRSIETYNLENISIIIMALHAALQCYKFKQVLEGKESSAQLKQQIGYLLVYEHYLNKKYKSISLEQIEANLKSIPAAKLFSVSADENTALQSIVDLNIDTNQLLISTAESAENIKNLHQEISPFAINVSRDKFNFQSNPSIFFRSNLELLFAAVTNNQINRPLNLPQNCDKKILMERVLRATILLVIAIMHRINNFNRLSDHDFKCVILAQSIIRSYIDHAINNNFLPNDDSNEAQKRKERFLQLLIAIYENTSLRFSKLEKERLLTIAFKTGSDDIIKNDLSPIFSTLDCENNSFSTEDFFKTCENSIYYGLTGTDNLDELNIRKIEEALKDNSITKELIVKYYNARPKTPENLTDFSKLDYFLRTFNLAKTLNIYEDFLQLFTMSGDNDITDIIIECETYNQKQELLTTMQSRFAFNSRGTKISTALINLYSACYAALNLIASKKQVRPQLTINEEDDGQIVIDPNLIKTYFTAIIIRLFNNIDKDKADFATRLLNAATANAEKAKKDTSKLTVRSLELEFDHESESAAEEPAKQIASCLIRALKRNNIEPKITLLNQKANDLWQQHSQPEKRESELQPY